MNGIDISSYQAGIDLSKVPCDFVIIKATQGITYTNGDLNRTYSQARKLGKKIGLYHYASKGGAVNEAKHFLKAVESLGALGKAILILDWESDQNSNWSNYTYPKEFLDYIRETTGIIPFIYMSKSVCRSGRWGEVAAIYPLWVAQYANRNKTGYKLDPWTDNMGYGPWTEPKIFQYSSTGILEGYGSYLDLDIAYMSDEEWDMWAAGSSYVPKPAAEPYAGIVTATALNVRTSPGGPIMVVSGRNFALPKDMLIAICEERQGWGRLSYISGWVSLQYVRHCS